MSSHHMSYQTASGWAVEAVLKHSQSKGSARLLLLLIARHIDEGDASPSKSTLCREMNLDKAGVRRHINKLKELQELEIEERGGFHGRNRYTIVLPLNRGELARYPCDSAWHPGGIARGAELPGAPAESPPTRAESPGVNLRGYQAKSPGVISHGVQFERESAYRVPAPGRAMMHVNEMNEMHHALHGDDLRSNGIQLEDPAVDDLRSGDLQADGSDRGDRERDESERDDCQTDNFETIAEALMAQGVSPRIALRLAKSNPAECLRQLKYLSYWRQVQEIRDSGGWLHDAITKAYCPPRNYSPPSHDGRESLHVGKSLHAAQLPHAAESPPRTPSREPLRPMEVPGAEGTFRSCEPGRQQESPGAPPLRHESHPERQRRLQPQTDRYPQIEGHPQADEQRQSLASQSVSGERTPRPPAIRQPPAVALRAIEETKAILGQVPVCSCPASRPGENAATLHTTGSYWVCYYGQCRFRQQVPLRSEVPLPLEVRLPLGEGSEDGSELNIALLNIAQGKARRRHLNRTVRWLDPTVLCPSRKVLSETLASGRWQYAPLRRQRRDHGSCNHHSWNSHYWNNHGPPTQLT